MCWKDHLKAKWRLRPGISNISTVIFHQLGKSQVKCPKAALMQPDCHHATPVFLIETTEMFLFLWLLKIRICAEKKEIRQCDLQTDMYTPVLAWAKTAIGVTHTWEIEDGKMWMPQGVYCYFKYPQDCLQQVLVLKHFLWRFQMAGKVGNIFQVKDLNKFRPWFFFST